MATADLRLASAVVDLDGLPEGWDLVPLGQIADCALGKMLDKAKHRSGVELPYLRNANVQWGVIDATDVSAMFFKDDELERYGLRPGDLLVCEGGEPGRAAVWDGRLSEMKFQKALHRVRPRLGIDPRWILWQFQLASLAGRLEEHFTGSTIKHLTGRALARFPVVVAPLPEQRRIVAKVEALLAGVNAARDRLARVPVILKRFRQSVLAAACSGRLTEDWRAGHPEPEPMTKALAALRAEHERVGTGKRGNAAPPSEDVHDLEAADLLDSWVVSELKWLCQPERPITYGILKPGPHREDGVLYVRVADYPNDGLVLRGIRRTSHEIAAEYRRASLRAGDLLLAIRGTFGRVCQVPPELDGGNLTQDTARIAVAEGLDPAYVATFLRSPAVQDRLKRAAKGVAVRGVNIGDVRAVQVALPPTAEQREIVRRVEALVTIAGTVERLAAAALRRVDRLSQSILSIAFRGELVAPGHY